MVTFLVNGHRDLWRYRIAIVEAVPVFRRLGVFRLRKVIEEKERKKGKKLEMEVEMLRTMRSRIEVSKPIPNPSVNNRKPIFGVGIDSDLGSPMSAMLSLKFNLGAL